jgi:hypothetical protein
MFYPKTDPKEGWSQALKRELGIAFPEGHQGRDGLFEAIDYLRAVVEWRNALQHPGPDQQVIFYDYELSAQGVLMAPSIEIRHRSTPLERQDLVRFLKLAVFSLGNAFEILISVCCDQNVRQFSNAVSTRLAKFPEDKLVHGSRYVWQSEWREGFPMPPLTSEATDNQVG